MNKRFEIALIVAILLLGGYIRFSNITTTPGFEWDEPVYTAISERTTNVGYPNLKGEANSYSTETYLYHPPFDFYIKGAWYKIVGSAGIGEGRILSAIEGMITIIVAFFCLKDLSGKKAAVIGAILLTIDGWLVYTNRLNLIENGMMPLGVVGIWFYVKASKQGEPLWYALSGLFLAFAAIYKHTGIPFVLVPFANLLITKQNWKTHQVMFTAMFAVVSIYVATMLFIWPSEFLFDNWVQIGRVLGAIKSRGLNYGLDQIATAITQTYWVFFATVCAILGVGFTLVIRLFQVVFLKRPLSNSILLSWSLVTFSFLAVIALKAPHYLITVLIPAYMFIASEVGSELEKIPFKNNKHIAVVVVLCLCVIANIFTWNTRFVIHQDNALLETYNYFKTVPASATVLADECIGPVIAQPYFNINWHFDKQDLERIQPDYVVVYTSITQKLPENPELENLLARSQIVKQVKGFKETITIYQVNPLVQVISESK